MKILKFKGPTGAKQIGLLVGETVHVAPDHTSLTTILHHDQPADYFQYLVGRAQGQIPFAQVELLPPIDQQEIWAAGVTYKRSKVAREEESKGAASFYDKVYSADRPELFMKASAWRAVTHGDGIRIRRDGTWNVPEPELTLVINPKGTIVGYTVGNDVSSRDIEGENPLYLPQAKIYNRSCAIGPVIALAASMPPLPDVQIKIVITRAGQVAFNGQTSISMMARDTVSLANWLTKELSFPDGAFLMTGTGIVPPDSFTLAIGDTVAITIDGIGTLENPVVP